MLGPIADSLGLASRQQVVTPILPPTLLSVPPSNYSFLSAQLRANVPVEGSLETAGAREIAFYVMDAGNFSKWRAGHPSMILLAKSAIASGNFTFVPINGGMYYFVFDNQDTTVRNVIFTLNSVETITALTPLFEFAGYGASGLGIILAYFGVRGPKRKAEPVRAKLTGWKCKFCGTHNNNLSTFCESCGRSQS